MRRRRCLRTCLKTKNSAGGHISGPVWWQNRFGTPLFLRVQILSSTLKGLEKALKSGCKKSGLKTVTTSSHNGQNSSDLDPVRGPAYLAKPVRDGPKKWSPKSCFSDHISRDCLNKRLVSLFKHVLKQRLRRNERLHFFSGLVSEARGSNPAS